MSDADSRTCLEMRLAILEAVCSLDKPLPAAPVPGALPDAFRRAFRTAVSRSVSGGLVPLVYGARSVTGKQMPPAVQAWTEAGASQFKVRLILFGSRAVGLRDRVVEGLAAAGALGLDVRRGGGRLRFAAFAQPAFEGTLAHYAREVFGGNAPTRLAIEFVSPCVVDAASPGATPSLGEIVGNVGYDLALHDLEDRGKATALGRERSDLAACQAREAAEQACAGVRIETGCLAPQSWGERRSGTNEGVVRLSGFHGYLCLAGDLGPSLPWLATLTLRGAGQKRSYGAGQVRLFRGLL